MSDIDLLIYPEFKIEVDILNDLEYNEIINNNECLDIDIKVVLETIRNINKSVRGEIRKKYRIISLFILIEDKTKARSIAEKYTNDEQILECIELSDAIYKCWLEGKKTGLWNDIRIKVISIIDRLDEDLFFYNNFLKCYKQKNNKIHESVKWFEEIFEDFI